MEYISLQQDETILLRLYVQPKASKTRITGLHDGCLRIAVASPPVEGKANKEIIKFLAKALNRAKADIILKTGAHSRRKVVVVKNSSFTEIKCALEIALDSSGTAKGTS